MGGCGWEKITGCETTSGGLVAAGPALQGPPDLTQFPAHLATRESQSQSGVAGCETTSGGLKE